MHKIRARITPRTITAFPEKVRSVIGASFVQVLFGCGLFSFAEKHDDGCDYKKNAEPVTQIHF
jgi:hypothetical protein